MDGFVNKNTDSVDKDALNDNRIYFTFRNEKRTSRTYVWNLEKHIDDKKHRDKLVKELKKKLATSCIYLNDSDGSRYGFQGDHKNKLIKYLQEIGDIDSDNIKN